MGAGCSVDAKIPTASRLVRNKSADSDWLRRFRDLRQPKITDKKLNKWARKALRQWDPKNPGGSYGDLIKNLFPTDGDRQQEIERICDNKLPTEGYETFSSLMSLTEFGGRFNVVLTTNFDDVLADAFAHTQDTRPLVIHHDSLAPFIRTGRTRPMIVKLHGDHQLTPRNTEEETKSLNAVMQQRVAHILHDRALVFIGYGGNDESILKMLESLPGDALPFGVFWISKYKPQNMLRGWLEDRRAIWVKEANFEKLMKRINHKLNLGNPVSKMVEHAMKEGMRTYEMRTERESKKPATPSRWTRPLFTSSAYQLVADDLIDSDPDLAEKLYEEGVKRFPESSDLLRAYAIFLNNERMDYDQAERYFKQAVDANPKDATNLGYYASFLATIRFDNDEADPKNANSLGNYANFLRRERKDYDKAEEFYKRAIEADPNHAVSLGNYASFLYTERKDFDQAEELYKRAIEADLKNANSLGNYATFLRDDRKDFDQAEKYYKRAIEADPNNANTLGNYSQLLFAVGRSEEGREKLDTVWNERGDRKDLSVELAFYGYAHDLETNRSEWLRRLKKLLEEGARSPSWDLSANVERAKEDDHPEGEWLSKLADVVADKEPIDVLSDWGAWQDA